MSRFENVAQEVKIYVRNVISLGPVGKFLPRTSLILTGVDPGLVWDILAIMPQTDFEAFAKSFGNSFVDDDHVHSPPIFTKVRSHEWLQRDMESRMAIALWLYGNAIVLQDPNGIFGQTLAMAEKRFRQLLPAMIQGKYLELRSERHNLRHIVVADRGMAFKIVKANIAKLALELSLLVEGKPYPYKKWLPTVSQRESATGQQVHDLCSAFLDENDGNKTIEISEQLVSFLMDMLRNSGMFSEDFIERWWLHLR